MYWYWYKKRTGKNNFGDELNPYIIGKLSNQKINYLPIPDSRLRRLLKLIKGSFEGKFSFHDSIQIFKSLKTKTYYTGIGSVIEWVRGKNCHIWGAGLINSNGIIQNCQFHAVRGKITQTRIKELGFNPPDTIGDPALLLPLIYSPSVTKRYKLGIVPHFTHYNEISEQLKKNPDILLINLQDDIEQIINQIYSCNQIITSSLHGLIVSHTYNIPALWVDISAKPLAGDNIKFIDYFSSVEISPYAPLSLKIYSPELLPNAYNIFEQNNKLAMCEIKLLQKIRIDLLRSAPFSLTNSYKNLLTNETYNN